MGDKMGSASLMVSNVTVESAESRLVLRLILGGPLSVGLGLLLVRCVLLDGILSVDEGTAEYLDLFSTTGRFTT